MHSWEDGTLAMLRAEYAGLFYIWTVRGIYPKPHTTWCARRLDTDTACLNAGSPEDLIRLMGEMVCQCPLHRHQDQPARPAEADVQRITRKYLA